MDVNDIVVNKENTEESNIPIILNGDVLLELKKLDTESINCIITSPPYWGQRDYDNDLQWGNEKKLQEYLDRMLEWANECKRVLKNEGTLFLNIGDKYNKKSLQLVPERLCIKMCDNGWCLRNKIIWYKPNHQPSGVKDRFVNTWEYIYFFSKDSFKYYNYKYFENIDSIRIPYKTTEPNNEFPYEISITDYENIYKNKINEYNSNKKYTGKYKDEKSINKGGSAGARKSSGIQYSKQRIHKIDSLLKTKIHNYLIEYYKNWKTKENNCKKIDKILGYKDKSGHWFRTDPGGSLPLPNDWINLKNILEFDDTYDKIMTEEHYVLQNLKHNPKGKNPGDMWSINLVHSKEKHFAAFPIELPIKIINAFCPPDGILLDPFAGSGTTGLAAMQCNIKSIMIELNPDYCEIMTKRFTD